MTTPARVTLRFATPADAEALVALLESQASVGVPQIDLWIITHPHLDHYGAIREICENESLRRRIAVKQFV